MPNIGRFLPHTPLNVPQYGLWKACRDVREERRARLTRALLELPGEDSNLGCQDQNLEC
jgi:hypothetical protein